MKKSAGIFSWFFAVLMGVCCPRLYAAAPVNPRASDSDNLTVRSAAKSVQSRSATAAGTTRIRAIGPTRVNASGGRSATTITAVRATTPTKSRATSKTSTTRSAVPASRARSASRAATTNARAGRGNVIPSFGAARSATARATAVFSDVSKIGSGYAECRESYSTCMDQLCANANDTYRRCFCSDRFTQFRDIENSLDQAMIMLQQFQDNELNAVDKTAAEVTAMYSPTVGEMAIKNDTSAAAKALDAISDLLSGKSTTATYSSSSNSLGILDLDFSSDLDDIWSGGDVSSIFSSSNQDLSTLEGTALFNGAQRQCVRLSEGNCSSDAVFSMARSSYNILITQDCNTYEKTLDKKRETVAQAVRMAEKYLREARLEEYRSHNSADVNECIALVRSAMLMDTACGENYKRCLDPTGAYINGATGEAIYTPRLFELEKTINLSGDVGDDVLSQNRNYEAFLDGYRQYVTRELDSCRDIADFVWTEFKRNAIIEIAQAQSEKIEDVKSSCVDIIAECYDSTTNSLKNVDKNTATTAAALARYTAGYMCQEQVTTCAALYGNESCTFDERGRLTSDNCGLTQLLNYVSVVDSLSIAEKCESALDEYVKELCTPESSTYSYPYKCRMMSMDNNGSDNNMNLYNVLKNFADTNCKSPNAVDNTDGLETTINTRVDLLISEIDASMYYALADLCEESGGMWSREDTRGNTDYNSELLPAFYNTAFGGTQPDKGATDGQYGSSWGYCYRNSAKLACEYYQAEWGDTDTIVARWDSPSETCVLGDEWYRRKCSELGEGYYIDGVCYIKQD